MGLGISQKEISQNWTVRLNRQAEKQYKKLEHHGSKPAVTDVINLLIIEMRRDGPYRANWPHYSPLAENVFHCHLQRGRPTYVACWKVIDEENKIIEVYYVGTHENAPYQK